MNFDLMYTKRVLNWLAEGKIVIMCLLVIIASASLGFYTWRSEFSIKFSGYALQLIGMIFAIKGLLGIREYFNQPCLISLFTGWLERFPKWKKVIILETDTFYNESIIMKPRVESWIPDNIDHTVEQRVSNIIKNLELIREKHHKQSRSIEQLENNLGEHKKEVVRLDKKRGEDIHAELEFLNTNDLIQSFVGLIFLTIGITMSTLAPELNKWLN